MAARTSSFWTDVLSTKNKIRPKVEKAEELRQRFRCSQVKLVANLPYSVAVPVIPNFLAVGFADRFLHGGDGAIRDRFDASWARSVDEGLRPAGGLSPELLLPTLLPGASPSSSGRLFSQSTGRWPQRLPSKVPQRRETSSIAVAACVAEVAGLSGFLRRPLRPSPQNLRGGPVECAPADDARRWDVDAKLAELGIDGTVLLRGSWTLNNTTVVCCLRREPQDYSDFMNDSYVQRFAAKAAGRYPATVRANRRSGDARRVARNVRWPG